MITSQATRWRNNRLVILISDNTKSLRQKNVSLEGHNIIHIYHPNRNDNSLTMEYSSIGHREIIIRNLFHFHYSSKILTPTGISLISCYCTNRNMQRAVRIITLV